MARPLGWSLRKLVRLDATSHPSQSHPTLLSQLRERCKTLAGARIIPGAHGAGTMNILLAPAACHRGKINHPQLCNSAVSRVAGELGNPNGSLFSEPMENGFETCVVVGRLRALLDSLESRVVS